MLSPPVLLQQRLNRVVIFRLRTMPLRPTLDRIWVSADHDGVEEKRRESRRLENIPTPGTTTS